MQLLAAGATDVGDLRDRAARLSRAHVAGLTSAAAIHGYTIAFEWAAVLFGVGLLAALLILPTDGAARARTAQAEAGTDLALSVEGA